MSFVFSDSETFVLGALAAASQDKDVCFYDLADELFGMLGLTPQITVSSPEDELVQCPPDDIIWAAISGVGENRPMSSGEVSELQQRYGRELDAAFEILLAGKEEYAGTCQALHAALAAYSTQCGVFGFALSTPNLLYGLDRGGRVRVVERTSPLPEGFVHLVLAAVAQHSTMPLGLLMAIPEALTQKRPEDLQSLLPTSDTYACYVGNDDDPAIYRCISNLVSTCGTTGAFALGYELWSLRTEIQQQANRLSKSELLNTDSVTISGPSMPEHLPAILKEVMTFALNREILDSASLGERGPPFDNNTDLKAIATLGEKAAAYAKSLDMVQVATLIDEVRLKALNNADWQETLPFLWADADMLRSLTERTKNAVCLAYGDLLLRERFSPDPVPSGRGKSAVFRQPEQIRAYLEQGLRFQRDRTEGHNHAIALTIGSVVLEPLVRQAAEFFLGECRSPKVADILHALLDEAKRRCSPERGEMEVFARMGMALHHGYRNKAVHSVGELAGDWESSQFFYFGLLSMLNVLEGASRRLS